LFIGAARKAAFRFFDFAGTRWRYRIMDHFSQYQILVPSGERWTMIASFQDFNVAYAVARGHGGYVRLMRVTYEGGQPMEQELVAEVGRDPQQP
jgi:hypothetical protein